MIELPDTPKPARLSREAMQRQTRERLLDAAEQLFIRDGFNGTSLRDIAAHAGYSQGAFYSNFRDKSDVLLELLARHKAAETARGADMIAGLTGHPDEILAGLKAWSTSLDETPAWCVLSVELQLHAARDPVFATHYQALWETQRDDVADIIGLLFAKLGHMPPAPPRDLAAQFMALIHGIALQRISTPGGTTQPTSGPTMLFLRGLLAQGSRSIDESRS